mmetsp:Transcript_19626/g.63748  ORF Transcript_19626/g.63748 Transcript_19626/m.63748 type:complete len:97 (+) Transcript_19626:242-532(+)
MAAWQKDQKVPSGSKITFLADTQSKLTEELGMTITHPGPGSVLGAQTKRCKRFAMYVVDGVIKKWIVSEAPDDPAGDDNPHASCIDNMLKEIAALA